MSLSSLIVQRGVATMRQVEEALARQVIYGGDLVTNLLEVVQVDEGVLTALLAESMGVPPAPIGELPALPDRVRALVPPEMAAQRGVVPLSLEGDRLVVAVAEPMPAELGEQLAFALGMTIEQRAAPSVRVRQAIANAYGVPLERRMQRLIARLSGGSTASGSMPPPLGAAPSVPEAPRAPSSPPARVSARMGTPAYGTVPRVAPQSTYPSLQAPRTTSRFPAMRPAAGQPADGGVPPAPAPAPTHAHAPAHAPAPFDTESPSGSMPAARRAGLLQREVTPAARAARRRRGPLTIDVAKHEVEEAADRDALLDLYFDFSRQFFDYAALFLVHGDIAEGRDAFGAGATRERVRGIGVPLDLPSVIASAREKRLPVVTRVAADGLDAELLGDLQRPRDAEVAIVPLVVRTRAVAILVGDCGETGIDRTGAAQVIAFAGVIGKAFERIIVRRKLEGFIAGSGQAATAGKVDPAMVGAKAPSQAPPARAADVGVPLSSQPPPAANIASVRSISSPPIPREEPGSPAAPALDVTATRRATRSNPPSASPTRAPAGIGTRTPTPTPGIEVHVDLDGHGRGDVEGETTLFDELGSEPYDGDDAGPPMSAAIAVPPHKPPPPRPSPTPELPKVIVNLDDELDTLVDRVLSDAADDVAEGELLRQGERAMRVLMSRFPGPVSLDRARIAIMASPPRPSECGPLLRLVVRQRKVALPFVIERLTAGDPEVRGWATHLLGELPYTEALPHLLLRLRDFDAATRVSAAHAVAAVGRAFPDETRAAVAELARSVDPGERAAAIRAMAELRDPGLVPELVHALGDGDEGVVGAAHGALVQVTRQDFGGDARPWLRWWEQNGTRHRIEWLIDALTHEVSEIRRAAGEELRATSKEYFGYASDLPARDRERAQQRYRDWWTTDGRARFRRGA